jgi:hypothetical protein
MATNTKLSTVARKETNGKNKPKGFSVTVHTPTDMYKEGSVLTEPRHIVDYLLTFTTDDEATDKRLETIASTDAGRSQIMETIQNVSLDGVDAKDETAAFLSALKEARFVLADETSIPEPNQIRPKGSASALAREYGQLLDAGTQEALTVAVEGKKDADAGAPIVAQLLKAQYGEVMVGNMSFIETVPIMGTNNRSIKNPPKVPYGEDATTFKGPWHRYRIPAAEVSGASEDIVGDWVVDFFGSSQEGLEMEHEASFLRFVVKNSQLPDKSPLSKAKQDHYKAVLNAPGQGVHALTAILADKAFEFGNRVNILTKAFRIWQKERELAQWFEGRIEVGFLKLDGMSEKEAARQRKPIVFYDVTWEGKDKSRTATAPQPLSKLMQEFRKYPRNSSVATIVAVKRGKPEGSDGNKEEPGRLAPEINTPSKLEEYVSSVVNYLDTDGAWSEVMAKAVSPADGGQLASCIVMLHAKLSRMAGNADIQRLAQQYLDNTAAATAKANKAA